ncbi:TetR family transcriptional regulator [Antricoccus suffuscus]|uniref:TetR family transcriptional regulator n=1 Tax=Antricoccus suffuscus TaxID=1629062 RepID=A0A2T1A2M4_9ACTN|nr:TetR/AcrR family transcriptional regulator [Antricoccus suffuscus]PRZ42861.1 TetR family transcriptional regulator [Antricoccus suffuscus]
MPDSQQKRPLDPSDRASASSSPKRANGPRTRGGWLPAGTAADRRAVHSERGTARGQKTRRHLLDAARRVFERTGYIDTSIEDIVKEAKVSRGSFYTYFATKLDVFRVLSAEVGAKVAEAVSSQPDGERLDPIEALRASNRRYIEVYEENLAIYDIARQVSTIDADVLQHRVAVRRAHIERTSERITRWQRRGVADPAIDPTTTAAALVSMTGNFCYWWFVGREDYDRNQAESTITDIWVRAVDLRRRPRKAWLD